LVQDIDDAINKVEGEINTTINAILTDDVNNLYKKKSDLMDLKMILTGTKSLNYADVFSGSPPSIQKRLGNMRWELANTTSKQTKTHEMTYKIANKKHKEILKKYKEIIN